MPRWIRTGWLAAACIALLPLAAWAAGASEAQPETLLYQHPEIVVSVTISPASLIPKSSSDTITPGSPS